MSISLIAAIGKNGELGYKGDLLVHLPNDLKRFKTLTTGKMCVQGRKTYESIIKKLGHPLSNRINIVLSKDSNYKPKHSNTFVYHSIREILHQYHNYGEGKNELMICGGSQIYKNFLPYADYIYLTIIDHVFDKADTFFPKLNLEEWKIEENLKYESDDKHPYPYTFITLSRKLN